MISTTITGLVGLIIDINIALVIFYLIKLVCAKFVSSSVDSLYTLGERYPVTYKIIGGLFSILFIALCVFIGNSL